MPRPVKRRDSWALDIAALHRIAAALLDASKAAPAINDYEQAYIHIHEAVRLVSKIELDESKRKKAG